MESTSKLKLLFDPKRLKIDLADIPTNAWTDHFVGIHYENGWSGVSLRAAGGSPTDLAPKTGNATYVDTPLLLDKPYFREILSAFKCPLNRVRLLKLAAGSEIFEHIDPGSGYEHKEIRFHIPIITHNDVEFYSNRKRVVMREGEVWFIDVSYPHRVANRSSIDRVHLVIDCVVNDWVRAMLPSRFSQPRWMRTLAYRARVVRFVGLDIWRAARAGDWQEFNKRKRLLKEELDLPKWRMFKKSRSKLQKII